MNEAAEEALLVLSVPGLYCLLVLLGRWLKRQHGVRLGWPYHLFALALALALAAYLPALILDARWPFVLHLAAATFVLGSVFLIAIIDRYQAGFLDRLPQFFEL